MGQQGGFLCFEVEVTSNQLWHSNYSPYQSFLHTKIKQLKKEGLGYRKIAKMLNEENIKTPRGKTFFPSSVYSILKKKISDISNLHMKLNGSFIDINNTWLSPTKIRRITIIGSKKMLLFDEMDLLNPIKIYNKYAVYPKIEDFKKSFFQKKALIYEGKVNFPKIKFIPPLKKEIKHFFDAIDKKQKLITDFDFAFKISKFLSKI